MTTEPPEVTSSPPVTPKTFHSPEKMSSTNEATLSTEQPSKQGGIKDQSGQSGKQGEKPKQNFNE